MISLRHQSTTGSLPTDEFQILVGGEIVGFCQLRHKPSKSSDMPKGFENHIYYEIYPKYQSKSYATEALCQLLAEARKIGLSKVVLNIADQNIASQKVAERNGGVIFDTQKASDVEQTLYRKYVIKL